MEIISTPNQQKPNLNVASTTTKTILNNKKNIFLLILLFIFWKPLASLFKILWAVGSAAAKYAWVILPIAGVGIGSWMLIKHFTKPKPPTTPTQVIKVNIKNLFHNLKFTNNKFLLETQKKIKEILNENNKLKEQDLNWLIAFNQKIINKNLNHKQVFLFENLNHQLNYQKALIKNKEILSRLQINSHKKIEIQPLKIDDRFKQALSIGIKSSFYFLGGKALTNLPAYKMNFSPSYIQQPLPNFQIAV